MAGILGRTIMVDRGDPDLASKLTCQTCSVIAQAHERDEVVVSARCDGSSGLKSGACVAGRGSPAGGAPQRAYGAPAQGNQRKLAVKEAHPAAVRAPRVIATLKDHLLLVGQDRRIGTRISTSRRDDP